MQYTKNPKDTQARIAAYADRLFDIAFNLGCECEQLRDSTDKQAYTVKWHQFEKAVQEHAEAVYMLTYYQENCC